MSSQFVAGICNEKLRLYGVQFHPEVDLSLQGKVMLKNFLYDIAGLTGNYTLQSREQECIKHIKEVVGNNKVLMMLSGGVDSTVCAALLNKALRSEQVIAVHIDNGFMRKSESKNVVQSLQNVGLNVKVINAAFQFSGGTTIVPIDRSDPLSRSIVTNSLCRIMNPEEKRRIIGDVFIKIAEDVISELNLKPDEVILGQGINFLFLYLTIRLTF